MCAIAIARHRDVSWWSFFAMFAWHGMAHLVVPHDDGNVDEIGSRTIGWELIVRGVDVRCVAIIVGVPRERQWSFRRIVNARCRREERTRK